MADTRKATDGPSVTTASAYDYTQLPDWDDDFYDEDGILAFAEALTAPENVTVSPSEEDLLNPASKQPHAERITALNDWRPVRQRRIPKVGPASSSKRSKTKKTSRRGRDETREGWTYSVVKYPLLFFVCGWIVFLGICYLLTRFYIYLYEQYVTWRGTRDRLRKNLRIQDSYEDWVKAAKSLDQHLGNDKWKIDDEGSYYDWKTLRTIVRQLRRLRAEAEEDEKDPGRRNGRDGNRSIDDLRATLETCVKNNFAGIENPRLYCETYYGTKNLLQTYVDETTESLKFLFSSAQLTQTDKRTLSKHLSANFGRTALCLSGGATFAYYHIGIVKALLDAGLIPNIITGTSGGALVAALLATRTDEELKKLLVPALAYRITACHDPFRVWFWRWWKYGARFDSVDWAKRCAWFCRGSLTFREAYERTGRILNVSCVPSDPHSPTILANYLTAPDCVIWSAVLASAAVPGILNPVVLMRKTSSGKLQPYSFGHKWKDGSLRTDIPLKSLNLHFNVNFSIVSQVNPHVSLWFFSSRGTVGRPVTHRRGRGWRGGFLGSAIEQFIKLDLNKWLKVLRHLELLPRPLGQDWSEVFLQRFSGTVTIWPKTKTSDFWHILSDPSMQRLAGMIRAGQLAAWPKLRFVSNRLAIEKVIEVAREETRSPEQPLPTPVPEAGRRLRSVLSEEDLEGLLEKARGNNGVVEVPPQLLSPAVERDQYFSRPLPQRQDSPSFTKRMSTLWGSLQNPTPRTSSESVRPSTKELNTSTTAEHSRRSSVMDELVRQSRVFFDDFADESEVASDLENHTHGETTDEEEGASEMDMVS
ncbi:patatin-like phospholipase domain-containing [Lecanosticta acicola]|uniref:Patatin-like phospholipase domain-containing protein n=1 Tax=Lecanosticta acicola TaxID=111012 RepID=A0AAI9ED06_9PEZI|nr:patatin-like phospholipase domain-containing [Lecanosticta acicola]